MDPTGNLSPPCKSVTSGIISFRQLAVEVLNHEASWPVHWLDEYGRSLHEDDCMSAYEKMTLLQTWFIASVNNFQMSLQCQSLVSSLQCSIYSKIDVIPCKMVVWHHSRSGVGVWSLLYTIIWWFGGSDSAVRLAVRLARLFSFRWGSSLCLFLVFQCFSSLGTFVV